MKPVHPAASTEVSLRYADSDAAFLRELGKRVRNIREQRGMSRSVVCRQARVSERYLSQLESGDGNTSIVLLRRVTTALGASLAEMICDQGSVAHRLIRRFLERLPTNRLEDVTFWLLNEFGLKESARRNRIALLGLRGAGKTTLGRMLAGALTIPFVELDKDIEAEASLPLAEVFMLYGQSGYRRMEARCLQRVLEQHSDCVIAPGGGVVSEPETYELLLSKCFTIWLRATPEEHMNRVLAQGDSRPMADNHEAMDDLRRILVAREPLYSRADSVVDTSHRTVRDCLTSLIEIIKVGRGSA